MRDTARLKITEAEANEWAQALGKHFAIISLCAHLDLLRATPAIEFKKRAMDSVIKELIALEAKT